MKVHCINHTQFVFTAQKLYKYKFDENINVFHKNGNDNGRLLCTDYATVFVAESI